MAKLVNFQNSILGNNSLAGDKQDVQPVDETRLYTLAELGIEKSIFIKPSTFHLTVLMLKLWNKDRVNAARDVLKVKRLCSFVLWMVHDIGCFVYRVYLLVWWMLWITGHCSLDLKDWWDNDTFLFFALQFYLPNGWFTHLLFRCLVKDCMRGSLAKARVLYIPVEEIGDEGRLLRACSILAFSVNVNLEF